MKSAYETLFRNMLTNEKAYDRWLKNANSSDAPNDLTILNFYLTQHAYKFLTSNSQILRDLAFKTVDTGLGQVKYRKNSSYCILRGIGYFKKNDLDNSLNCFKGAIDLDSTNVIAHFYCGTIYSKKCDFEEAINSFYTALKHSKPTIHYEFLSRIKGFRSTSQLASIAEQRADAFIAASNYLEALAYYSLAKKLTSRKDPESVVVLLQKRASTALKLGQYYTLDAKFDCEKAIKIINATHLPNKSILLQQFYELLGDVLQLRNSYKEAISYYSKALEQPEFSFELFRKCGDCYEILGDHFKAVANYENYLKNDPENKEIKAKLLKLNRIIQPQQNFRGVKRDADQSQLFSEEKLFKKLKADESVESQKSSGNQPQILPFSPPSSGTRASLLYATPHLWQSPYSSRSSSKPSTHPSSEKSEDNNEGNFQFR